MKSESMQEIMERQFNDFVNCPNDGTFVDSVEPEELCYYCGNNLVSRTYFKYEVEDWNKEIKILDNIRYTYCVRCMDATPDESSSDRVIEAMNVPDDLTVEELDRWIMSGRNEILSMK